jgi:predicted adenine nucleotide alpha hydrolase (AANH) superfamily ATPase
MIIVLIKIVKIFSPAIWMLLIFWLSSKPLDYFPAGAPDYGQIIVHIFLYAVLSALIINAAVGINRGWKFRNIILFAIFFSSVYGISDEYHQGFVPGRTVSFLDLGFDFFGAVLGSFPHPASRERRGKPLFPLLRRSGSAKFPHPNPLPLLRRSGRGGNRLLLHVCCIGCGAYVAEELKKNYDVVLYFYNPNIFPEIEYKKRLEEARRIAKKFKLKLIVEKYDHGKWLKMVNGFESEPERGERCLICYRDRLDKTAKTAKENGFDYFATTLTISPHKDAKRISLVGQEMAEKYKVKFLDKDFKKNNGFKKSCELSKELGLYRQDYCGCEFSRALR